MQKGLILIAVISITIVAVVLFLPLPYYQKTDGWCESFPPQLCKSKGWHLRPSLWREISGTLEQTVSNVPTSSLSPSPIPQVSPSTHGPFVSTGCKLGGCNSEICQDEESKTMVSPCIALPKFGCYKTGRCEKQANDQCSWTQTQELQACLEKFPE